jgi:predicted DNA-binding WGR domain protein/outer membrane protein assembly factor BamB
MTSRRYLELLDDTGLANKFFEVTVAGSAVTVRFGDIGSSGRQQSRSFANAATAQIEADKMIAARQRKGYEDAVEGARAPVTARASGPDPAPVLWRFATGDRAFAVFANERGCWVGNEAGRIFLLGLDGVAHKQFQLPDGVKCIVADSDWLYAGCDDGRVYDLTSGQPFEAYRIDSKSDIYWMDVADAVLGVSDAAGGMTVFNHEDETQWRKQSDGEQGWMVRCDEIGVYHGHSEGVTMYDWEDGEELWHRDVGGAVMFGYQDTTRLLIGTNQRQVVCLSKQGDLQWVADCDASVFCCATSTDGQRLFAGDCDGSVYCFDGQGQRVWKLATGCGSALSMDFHDGRLYIVTSQGVAACVDAKMPAISAAKTGSVPVVQDLRPIDDDVSLAAASIDDLDVTSDSSGGVVVVCFEAANKLWVRVETAGYRADWVVQFPRNLRVDGARFVVDEIRPAARGSFYRAYGDIKRLS